MYALLLQSLGYAKDLDLSELEIGLEEQGKLEEFEAEYHRLFNKHWSKEKGKVAFALSEASRVLHSLDSATYPSADSWVKAVKNKADISPGKLAERAGELMRRRKPGETLMFVVDEVGQFVARDVQKMLDLQAVVQSLGVRGRGKHWVVVTSQETLRDIVSGLDGMRTELARLQDRFPLQVHLEPSDISEVTSRRVLRKNAAAEANLGALFDEHRGRLTELTRLSAEIRLPDLSRDAFVELYPLLPYQIDLIIQIVSGLRTQGGVSKHVGGANRTIIKLALGLARDLDTSDIHVEVIDLLGNHVEAELGVAFFVACYSALRKIPVSPALLVLGDLSIQGNIKPMRSLTEPLQVAKDNGAKRALIPIENKRNFLDVSADIMEHVDPIFFSDPKTAAMKVLGG